MQYWDGAVWTQQVMTAEEMTQLHQASIEPAPAAGKWSKTAIQAAVLNGLLLAYWIGSSFLTADSDTVRTSNESATHFIDLMNLYLIMTVVVVGISVAAFVVNIKFFNSLRTRTGESKSFTLKRVGCGFLIAYSAYFMVTSALAMFLIGIFAFFRMAWS